MSAAVDSSKDLSIKAQSARSLAKKREVLKLLAEGKTQIEVAEIVGVSRPRVSQIANEPEVRLTLQSYIREHEPKLKEIGQDVIASIKEDIQDPFWAARSSARGQYLNLLHLASRLEDKPNVQVNIQINQVSLAAREYQRIKAEKGIEVSDEDAIEAVKPLLTEG
jgi:transcriptional regulator with XRE-family HTH domain